MVVEVHYITITQMHVKVNRLKVSIMGMLNMTGSTVLLPNKFQKMHIVDKHCICCCKYKL